MLSLRLDSDNFGKENNMPETFTSHAYRLLVRLLNAGGPWCEVSVHVTALDALYATMCSFHDKGVQTLSSRQAHVLSEKNIVDYLTSSFRSMVDSHHLEHPHRLGIHSLPITSA